ncbi:34-kDa subunit of RNA polymerase III (C) [Coemansia sp. RSA 2523]|nr:34-kDa subunit of RNA polymerase III (C) [Coemansia sp. RSA 1591]KAJ1767516.1 34-kDa subunit of RNA polymerase III (C) [Coemansia sp. RSA 1752]KAJ1778019.1 34-kDa subunit of RNA polymerase III (C) [Coemansia sp. RSA 1824]KAJ1791642.1 34-kDa subunit of RNA polymerase III (C) [Coemansia sp. RSA 2167]KAJ1794872.1 34-kDa subunit of RNA polymerase III (C) [Coemansia sp. RSA 1938]KAJ1808412.1 34-kDa subunit of RNA polymerase III (C) [Coemansia sp. RSA 2523]KAJ2147994.1 34-kDa subunit of RNA poly
MDSSAELSNFIYEVSLAAPDGVSMDGLKDALPGYRLEEVVNEINRLLSCGKVELLQKGNSVLYKGVSAQELELLGGLSQDERLVYKIIENTANEGIWVRTIKIKSNLPSPIVNRAIKVLEQKVLIKSIKSIKFPTRKVYMLTHFTPSSDITGGPWYTDQEMDMDFIEQISNQCYNMIRAYSFPQHNPGSIYSADHAKYATAAKVRSFIMDNGISQVDLSVDHIEQLLNMLVYDGKIERLSPTHDVSAGFESANKQSSWMYRAVREVTKESPLTDIPCGRCPVANRCTASGDVSPVTCVYLSKWLSY